MSIGGTSLEEHDPVLDEVVARIVRALEPSEIHLFGSRATGSATRDSDYDLLVVVPESAEPPYRRAQHAYEALWGIRAAVDVIVLTEDELREQATWRSSVASQALRSGRRLPLHG